MVPCFIDATFGHSMGPEVSIKGKHPTSSSPARGMQPCFSPTAAAAHVRWQSGTGGANDAHLCATSHCIYTHVFRRLILRDSVPYGEGAGRETERRGEREREEGEKAASLTMKRVCMYVQSVSRRSRPNKSSSTPSLPLPLDPLLAPLRLPGRSINLRCRAPVSQEMA